MLVKVFTLGFNPATERFDDEVVRDFVTDKDVESISDHFFVRDGTAYLALVVCYRPTVSAAQTTDKGANAGAPRKRDESWRDTLDAADWPLTEIDAELEVVESRTTGMLREVTE